MVKTHSNQHLLHQISLSAIIQKQQANILYISYEGCILSVQPTTFKISELNS